MSPSGSAVVSMTKIPIRDHMDDIVESRGYYRKHVAQEKNSLFRAISDFLYSSQCFRDDLQLALKYFLDSEEGRRVVEQLQESGIQDHPHAEVILMANVLNESFDILDTADPEVERLRIVPHSVNLDVKFSLLASTDCIPPGMQITENRHDSHQGKKPIFLCYSGRHQYDPIYNKSSVDAAGFIQSILYERLYKDVFGVTDAMEAADIMLNGTFDPRYGKPDVYDKDFEGTAMEALQKFLIPFPYKVAKALDSESYRWVVVLPISNHFSPPPPFIFSPDNGFHF